MLLVFYIESILLALLTTPVCVGQPVNVTTQPTGFGEVSVSWSSDPQSVGGYKIQVRLSISDGLTRFVIPSRSAYLQIT